MKRILKGMFSWLGLEVHRKSGRLTYSVNTDILRRYAYFREMFALIAPVEGDVVECGVFQGLSLLFLSECVEEEGKKRVIWGFDSFEGFPDVPLEEESEFARKGRFGNTTLLQVEDFLVTRLRDQEFVDRQIRLVPGYFDRTLSRFDGDQIALLHLDCDLYDSYLISLNELYPKIGHGGVICFDEYHDDHYPGATRAIDEFFGRNASMIQRDDRTGKHFLIKP